MTASDSATQTTGLLAPAYRWATAGMVSLVFLAAFEALAVTTIMPTVATALDGQAWFSVAFSATLAASVVGMVAVGLLADRYGPVWPLLGAVAVFALGLLLAGLAPSIEVFVAARFGQGLGAGALTVVLYVLVARIFHPVDHARIFGAFAAAWVLPSLVGPTIAGVVAETIGWRWVFLGVVVLALGAALSMLPSIRSVLAEDRDALAPVRDAEPDDCGPGYGPEIGLAPAQDPGAAGPATVRDPDPGAPSGPRAKGRMALAVAVALAVVVLDLGGQLRGPARFGVALLSLVAVLAAVRPLLPRGTLRLRRGLPAVLALRGLIAAAFFSAEIYLPFLLQARYGVSPSWSGVTLTLGALGWAGASQVQATRGPRLDSVTALWIGAVLLLAGVGSSTLVAALHLSAPLLAVTWACSGAGMGLMFPRISVLVLAASGEHDRGRNSAAMSIADAVGASCAISVAGLVFTALGSASTAAFTAALSLAAGLAVLAVLVSVRCRETVTG